MRLLTPAEVARRGGVNSSTVRYWGDTGKLPVLRTESGRRLFTESAVQKFLQKREGTSGSKVASGV
jgi:excisionase family DNA binding protein